MFKQLKNIGLAVLSSVVVTLPSQAAERINFVYGPVKLSLQVNSLDIFVNDNIVNKNLEFYLNLVDADEEDKQRLREILTTKAEVDPIRLGNFTKKREQKDSTIKKLRVEKSILSDDTSSRSA